MVEYEIEGRIAVIIGCSEDEEDITLPEYIEGYPVGKIAANSFNELSRLKRIVFPKTLRLIGAYAFASCRNLKEVIFSEGLEIIEDWAFISCKIDAIHLPSTLRSMGEHAFMGNPVWLELSRGESKKEFEVQALSPFMAVFPIGLWESIDNITGEIIAERAGYCISQMEALTLKKIEGRRLDLPFVFDKDELLLAITSKVPLTDFQVSIAEASREELGKYETDDPDFLVIRLEVFAARQSVGQTAVKIPYSEAVSFAVEEVSSALDTGYCYFLRISSNLDCYGTGNAEREFAFNLFDELDGKYQTEWENHLIPEETYRNLQREIEEAALDTVKDFFTQLQGAPVLTYLIQLFKNLLSDEEYSEKEKITSYIASRLKDIYTSLGDYESLEEVCFSMREAVRFAEDYTGLSAEEINQKYGIYIQNEEEKPLTTEEIAAYRIGFADVEYNFTLYAEYLNYIYQLMDKLNQEYAMKTYQE